MGDATLSEIKNQLDRLEQMIFEQRGVRPQISKSRTCELTFVSPCYNELENLNALYTRITAACTAHRIANFEIIWIENGSHDGSMERMKQLAATDSRLRIVQLSRNFGYQGAIACGLAHARGEFVAVLDGDLQDQPELIPKMLQMARTQNLEVVYGVRTKRQEGFLKRFAYRLFYRIWKFTAEINVPVDAGDFCVMSAEVVRTMNSMPERQRFNRGLRAWVGFRQAGFPYARDSRFEGKSKFNLTAMVRLAFDGIIAYSVAPLRVATIVGIGIAGVAFFLGFIQGVGRLLSYYNKIEFTGILPPGVTQISLVMLGLFGVQIFLFGVLGEYIGRIYGEVKDRPLFVVREHIQSLPISNKDHLA